MNNALIFILYAPIDYEWAYQLAEQLKNVGLNIYIETLEIPEGQEATHRQKTTKALYDAQIMLPIISRESAVGESATVFENWWRPFLEKNRQIIACIVPDAPDGAEHWMPFDLFRRQHIDFRTPDSFDFLCELLGVLQPKEQPLLLPSNTPIPSETTSNESPPTSEDETINSLEQENDEAESTLPVESSKTLPTTPSPPTPQSLPFSLDDEDNAKSRSLLGLIKNVLSGLIGFAAVLFIWQASLQTTDSQSQSPESWLLGLSAILTCLFIAGRIAVSRRERQQALEKRRKIAKKWGTLSDHSQRPPVYIEVIESPIQSEISQVWAIVDEAIIIGYGSKADIPLQSRNLDSKHCMIFYDDLDGYYYLENTCQQLVTYHDQVLEQGAVVQLANGDLITLENSLILQFRIQ